MTDTKFDSEMPVLELPVAGAVVGGGTSGGSSDLGFKLGSMSSSSIACLRTAAAAAMEVVDTSGPAEVGRRAAGFFFFWNLAARERILAWAALLKPRCQH